MVDGDQHDQECNPDTKTPADQFLLDRQQRLGGGVDLVPEVGCDMRNSSRTISLPAGV